MLGHRPRRWPNINPSLGEYVLFAGYHFKGRLDTTVNQDTFLMQVSPLETEYPTATQGSGLWIGGHQHEPYARMHPWPQLYNIHGLSDHYTNYYYECAPRPTKCCSHEACGSDILFCHDEMCKAKVASGGVVCRSW